ncbi:TetR family transcriptional regulator [Gulosibacter macacae]|uniref:TetR family transcriptional regulator n=1 Tax=Gulosibacter macacae TaxID=2488791 RepID=A0A3P3VYB8_9MICO|nr:TetR family transcriptional regulator [Gulosibacter macacae]RRJ87811.1 TetR family transcriptional regulator [Gulosibacter macacae]
MAISREQIVDVALGLITAGGLAAFSMRRLADELDVSVNSIYWHVPNKQELLAAVGSAIVAGSVAEGADARTLALTLRQRMLAVRDGAEIVAIARAKHPGAFAPALSIARALEPGLGGMAAQAAEVLTIFVIGATIEEQTRRELELVDAEAAALADLDREAVIALGVDALLAGLSAS